MIFTAASTSYAEGLNSQVLELRECTDSESVARIEHKLRAGIDIADEALKDKDWRSCREIKPPLKLQHGDVYPIDVDGNNVPEQVYVVDRRAHSDGTISVFIAHWGLIVLSPETEDKT